MQILVIDLGSQYTQLIGRRLRDCGVRSLILPPARVEEWMACNTPRGIILSGGYASIYDKDAPKPPASLLLCGIPILGICYGMHWMVRELGGKVLHYPAETEYGETQMFMYSPDSGDALFAHVGEGMVWTSHGDSAGKIPEGFERIAGTGHCFYGAIRSLPKKMWGIQFHPEVIETNCGPQIFKNFLEICGAKEDWQAQEIIEKIQREVRCLVPKEERCVLGYSGGVDSSVLAKILVPVLGDRLRSVTIDAGHLREGEGEEIERYARFLGIRHSMLDYRAFGSLWLRGLTDAETKRESFQRGYFTALEEYARSEGARHLFQGTLFPDVIEASDEGEAEKIKTHHNVGFVSRYLIQHHPLRDLFKYEVRDIARALGLIPEICEREPFPGPGLLTRIVGIPATDENLSLVRWADYEVRNIVQKSRYGKEISQLVVALIGVKTVGVKGDHRDYGYAICVRAVVTSDFMTCRGYQFDPKIRRAIQKRLTTHPKITRVWFDENDKPPATVEFE